MDTEIHISALSLFIEKADKLNNSNFVKSITSNAGVNISGGVGKPTIVKRRGPNDENIDAFVLTFRFFIQDNETISLRNIKSAFHSNIAIVEEKNSYDVTRKWINKFLDENTNINFNGMIKRRELMDVFIYGGLSHANVQKKEKYDTWMRSELLAPLLLNEFTVIIFEVTDKIVFVRNLCESILKRINRD